jgi:hypothetical protein
VIQPKQEPCYTLIYSELDDLIQKHFNKPDFNCVADYEWSNDSQHTGTATIKDVEEGGIDHDEVQEFINAPGVPRFPCHWSILLAELARRGEVPEGNYIIEVCW